MDLVAFAQQASVAALKRFGPKILSATLGSAKDYIEYVSLNFSSYLESTSDRCSIVKTLVSRDEPINIYKIYVDTTFTSNHKDYSDKSVISSIRKNKPCIIIGTAGCGKSMFMRHLFLNLIENSDGRIPIFIEMRNINNLHTKDLTSFMYHSSVSNTGSISYEHFKKGMSDGTFAVIFDGFDEVDFDNRDELQRQIIELRRNFPNIPIVVSSRPDDCFASWTQFKSFHVKPMSKNQVISLMGKIPYTKSVRNKFISEIKGGLFEKHESFLSNPLLATMMLITFDQTGNIPDKMHIFYEQAFDTLFFRHDTSKEAGYKRRMHSELDISYFRNTLSALCLSTYLKEKFQFSEDELTKHVNLAFEHESIQCSSKNYVLDLLSSICVMQKDGIFIVFTHRSFQEYFSAYFIYRNPSAGLTEILDRCARRPHDNVIGMAHEMNKDLIEREWILPRLAELNKTIRSSGKSDSPAYVTKLLVGDITISSRMKGHHGLLLLGRERKGIFTILSRLYRDEFSKFSQSFERNDENDNEAVWKLIERHFPAPESKSLKTSDHSNRLFDVETSESDDDILSGISFFHRMLKTVGFLIDLERSIEQRVASRKAVGIRLLDT